MANTFFKYKQFTVHQEKTAQKVCTDTSLFGALIKPINPTEILDIGTGTGVLSLMIAQITEAKITAIEIEDNAFLQASENVEASNWKDRIEVLKGDVNEYANKTDQKFDLIISNPPFFQNSYKSDKNSKNLARHNESLSLAHLANCVNRLLTSNGLFWVLLPSFEAQTLCEELANYQLYLDQSICIKNYIGDEKVSRVVNCFSRLEKEPQKKEIAIYQDKNREYTSDFVKLLKPYYLYL